MRYIASEVLEAVLLMRYIASEVLEAVLLIRYIASRGSGSCFIDEIHCLRGLEAVLLMFLLLIMCSGYLKLTSGRARITTLRNLNEWPILAWTNSCQKNPLDTKIDIV